MFQYFKCFGWIPHTGEVKDILLMFQYFKCFGWILSVVFLLSCLFCFNTSNVSVELIQERWWRLRDLVSILQMFRLNKLFFRNFNDLFYVSILQMFRLNICLLIMIFQKLMFQYFKCFGWMAFSKFRDRLLDWFQYFKCFGWITE